MMAWIFIAAALLPFIATVSAKAGGRQFDNHEPRAWLEQQTGWRRRAHAAQQNTFEALPIFYAALLYALYNGADPQLLMQWAYVWLALRLAYLWIYIKDWASVRSLVWATALVVNLYLLFL